MSIVCLITIYNIVNYTAVNSEEPPIKDPDDPGNSPGPGSPTDIFSSNIVSPIIPLTVEIENNPIL